MSTNVEYRKSEYHHQGYQHQQQRHHQKPFSPDQAGRIMQLDAEFDQNLASMKRFILELKDRKRNLTHILGIF
jgi:hypothetical protein